MECIEARALKSSLLSEIAMKSTHQVDDFWCVTGINNVSSDDFSVDDLLDLSDKDFNGGSLEESEEDEEKDSLSSVSSQDRVDDDNSNSGTSPGSGDLGSLAAGELAVPVDDLEDLEWLSQFVDDSEIELSLLCPAGIEKPAKLSGNRSEPVTRPAVQNFTVLCLPSPVPRKARSKRTRRAGGTWSLGPLSGTEPPSPSQESLPLTSPLMSPAQVMESFFAAWKPPAKKQKKNTAAQSGSVLSGSQVQRRCTHCHVQKTPQWRSGPLGPKTLCNACGVRFKSGRLYPEYRPACSPTFSGDVHSNSHRKVLEMRRRKETVESDFSPAVPSFSAFEDSQMVAAI